ncbi:hypothetical protein KAR91_77410 [Candidatus Pacearchaeota archaeon]|nr:hypothetical protein [Candidatus Pacearchaeota archaeon]
MSIKCRIVDPATGLEATVVDGHGEETALAVATRELKTFENSPQFFVNSTFGLDMNQDVSAGGAPINVHNGTDNGYWTGSSIQGTKFTFDSLDEPHTGTRSVKSNAALVNDVMDFAAGVSTDVSGHVRLDIWIFVTNNWASGDSVSVFGWDGGVVGNAVFLEDYFSFSDFGVWHRIVIPLSDMALDDKSIDSLRFQIISRESITPLFYLDDIQFQETGAPLSYIIKAPAEKWLYVEKLRILMIDDFTGILADATMPKIPYNSFLGLSGLSTGVVYTRFSEGQPIQSFSFKDMSDFLLIPGSQIVNEGSDGTNTWLSMDTVFDAPAILKDEEDDFIEITISEDFSDLLLLRMSAACKEEDRSTRA